MSFMIIISKLVYHNVKYLKVSRLISYKKCAGYIIQKQLNHIFILQIRVEIHEIAMYV